jgi:hypothetical protein
VVKTTYENWADMQKAVPALRGMKPEQMVPEKLSHPFHDGAIRYFKEIGLWTPELDAQQAAFLKQ